jgi:autotransporter family porin
MTNKSGGVGLGIASVVAAWASLFTACPWSGLDYLVDGHDAAVPDSSSVVDAHGDGDAEGAAESGTDAAAPAHFVTLPVKAPLPTESDCAAWVNARPTPETNAENATANQTVPPGAWLEVFAKNPENGCSGGSCWMELGRVTGNFKGTTDMVIRWAACKWGAEEDVARALAMQKSSWLQSTEGDSDDVCHSRNVSTGELNYWSEASPCKPAKGLFQLKLIYVNAAPYASTSSALNADIAMGTLRLCMNGDISFLETTSNPSFGPYPPQDPSNALWGCVGFTYSGGWGDTSAVNYANDIKQRLATQQWPHS